MLRKLGVIFFLSLLLSKAEAQPSSGCGLAIYGEFLYWEVSQDQMQYAAVLKGGVQSIISAFSADPVQLTTDITLIDPNFQYKPGFRVGIDYEFSCSHLDINLAYTRLHQNTHSRIVDPNNGIIPLTMLASSAFGFIDLDPAEFGFANEATSRWDFRYDVIDLQIGSRYCFNYLVMHPFVGVKGASIKQNQYIEYFGFAISEVPVNLRPNKKNNFYGIGPSVGFDSQWKFCSNFALAGGVGASLLYGKFNVFEQPIAIFEDNFIAVKIGNYKRYRLRPEIDANIGLTWESCFCNCFNIALGVAYEVQYFWNQWQAAPSVIGSLITGGNSPQGDLMIHGLTATFVIGF